MSATDMPSWMVKRESLIVMLLRSYGSKLPDQLAAPIERITSHHEDPDAFSQALSQNVGAPLRDETSNLRDQIERLTQERDARDSVIGDLQVKLEVADKEASELQTALDKHDMSHRVLSRGLTSYKTTVV